MKNRHTSLCSGSVLHSCKRSPSPVDCIATDLLSSLCYNIPGGLSVGIETFGHNIVYSAEKEKPYSVLGPVHTSHFCRVEFNSIKCGRNATVDSYVALVSHLIQNLYCQVCQPAENVLNIE